MDELDQDGDRLSRALGRAMGEIGPQLGPLVTGAAARGRSLRRRRRAGAAASVAAVAALALGGALLVHPGTGAADTAAANGDPTLVAGTGPNAGKVALTVQAALLAAYDVLPTGTPRLAAAGSRLVRRGSGSGSGSGEQPVSVMAQASISADHAHGAQGLMVNLTDKVANSELRHPAGPALYTCATDVQPPNSCRASTLPDGSRLLLRETRSSTLSTREALLLRPDGTGVSVTAIHDLQTQPPSTPVAQSASGSPAATTSGAADGAANGAAPDGAAAGGAAVGGAAADGAAGPLADLPPITLEQLAAVAESAELQPWISPEFAARAATVITPFEDNSPPGPGSSARPSPGSTGLPAGIPSGGPGGVPSERPSGTSGGTGTAQPGDGSSGAPAPAGGVG